MILAGTQGLCRTPQLNTFFYIAKNIINLLIIIAPILAIISLTILFFQLMNNPDNNKLIKKLKNVFIALIVVFIIPVIVSIAMNIAGEKTDISACYKNATTPELYSEYINTSEEEPVPIYSDPEKYEQGTFQQLDFSCKSKHIKAQFSCDTIRIVERHINDFNYYNFDSYINARGGFEKYMHSLGGYFSKYYGTQPKVTTVKEFQEVAEYVLGMIVMYGFDYYNGEDGKYCKWGGGCQSMSNVRQGKLPSVATSDAFYPDQLIHNEEGLSDSTHFDRLISNKGEINMTTCCNWTTDMVYYKAGIFGQNRTGINHSASFVKLGKAKSNKVITNYEEIKPGDLLEWFESEINPNDVSTWKNWYHVSFVGEVDYKKKTFTAYETGSGLTGSRNHKRVHSMKKNNKHLAVIRVIDLK